MRNYDKVFEIRPGKRAYVQSPRFRARGRKLVGQTLCMYQPASIFYHYLAEGGHVTALRLHAPSRFITRFDIVDFFGHVTRSKITRALRDIGYWPKRAFNAAYESVVVQDKKVLPIGFVQSPLLATLVLEQSLLGRKLLWLSERIKVSIYMDDILVSGDDRAAILGASSEIESAASESHFSLSTEKSAVAQPEIVAFNCHVGSGHLTLTNQRMARFVAEYREQSDVGRAAVENYICAISVAEYQRFQSMLREPTGG